MLPALDVPVGVPPSLSVATARGSIAIALGRRTALRDLAAVASALATVALGVWLIAAGVPAFAVLITMLAMATGPTFAWRGVSWTSDTLSPALALLAAWALWRWTNTHRRRMAAVAIIAAALAMSEDPAWLAVLPGTLALVFARSSLRAWRPHAAAAVALLAFFAALPPVTRMLIAVDMPWAALLDIEPPGPWTIWRQSMMSIDGSSLTSIAGALTREFTPLGAMLAVVGVVILFGERHHRTPLAALIVGLLGWYWLAPRSRFEAVSVPLTICGWAAVAVALAWVQQRSTPRAGRTLIVIVGLVIIGEPALTRARLAALGKDSASEARTRMAYDLRIADLPPESALIAEARRVDAAVLLSSSQAGRAATIVPQRVEHVLAASRKRAMVAFAHARGNLERMGFLFERAWAGNTEVAVVAGHVPCVGLEPGEWADVSMLVANGSFILYGPATPGSANAGAPGGVLLRVTGPSRAISIEPRSIPFEIGEVPHDSAVGIPELDRAAARSVVEAVTTLRIRKTERRDPITFTFASAPMFAVATADDDSPVVFCPGVSRVDLTLGRSDKASAVLRMNTSAPFAAGWHSPEADPDPFRWTSAPNASVRVSVAPPGPIHVTISATPAALPAMRPAIDLSVNNCRLPARPMTPGSGDYEWDVEQSCWRAGVNQIWIGTSPLVSPAQLFGGHDTRPLGARIGAIRLTRVP